MKVNKCFMGKIFGNCGKHPGQSMVNCPLCHAERLSKIMILEGWNKVSVDGYPPCNKGVIVFIPQEDYHITSGMWDISKKWVLLDEYREPECEVTHWMECPKAPAEFTKEIEENNQVMKAFKYLIKKDNQNEL